MTSPGNSDPTRPSRLTLVGVDLRCGEVGLCWLLFFLHLLILTFQYTAKAIRQSTYIDSLGADKLPFVYLLSALCAYPLLVAYGKLADRWSQRRLLVITSLLWATCLVVFWWLFETGGRWVSIVFYLWVAIVGILTVSQFWSYASHLLDPRQAKRLFGFIGAGGILGSILGGQIARLSSQIFDTRGALLTAAGVLVALAVLVRLKGVEAPEPAFCRRPDDEALRDARHGFSTIRSSPYLLSIAVVMLLSAMVAQVIDLQFSWVVEQNTVELDERTAVFGNLFSFMGLGAFAFQLLFTARIHRRLGVGFALRVLPLSNGIGTLAFALAAAFMPSMLLPAVWLLKAGENGLRYSLDQATRELLFQPVSPRERPRAKAFIDVFVQRTGKGAAALLLLSVTFGWLTVIQTVGLSVVLIVVWLLAVSVTHRRYVSSFRDGLLQRGPVADSHLDLSHVATLELLVEGLGSSDDREVLHSLELLRVHGRGRLVTPMMLHHSDPSVRCKVLEILREEERVDATPLIQCLLVDPDPRVRATATRTLAALRPQDVRKTMMERLRDPDVRVRGAAVSYLAALSDPSFREEADSTLGEMLADGTGEVRLEAARAIGGIEEPHYQAGLVQLLYDTDPWVVRGAIEAVSRRTRDGGWNPLYVPILVSHLHNRRLKHEARDALVAYGEDVIPALQHFLNDDNEEIWVRRALPKTIARIGGQSALEALITGLDASDPFLRRKVIEALVGLRGHDDTLCLDPAVIECQLTVDCKAYLATLLDLSSLQDGPLELRGGVVVWISGDGLPHLLEQLLANRLEDHLSNLFGLLALIYPHRDIRAAYKSLLSDHPGLRAHALEYLDNLLDSEIRPGVFAVIDDLPMPDRLRRAQKLFHLKPPRTVATLRRLASGRPPGDQDAAWLTAAALHYIHDRGFSALRPVIRKAAETDDAVLVQETTRLLLSAAK